MTELWGKRGFAAALLSATALCAAPALADPDIIATPPGSSVVIFNTDGVVVQADIVGGTGSHALETVGDVAILYNSANIASPSGGANGVNAGAVGSFRNTGAISSTDGDAVSIYGAVGTFDNSGDISTDYATGAGVYFTSDVSRFSNSGHITALNSSAAAVDFQGGTLGEFVNSGLLSSAVGANFVFLDATSIVNLLGGEIVGSDNGLNFGSGTLGSFENYGTIRGDNPYRAAIEMDKSTIGAFLNAGEIVSAGDGIFLDKVAIGTMVNRGTISSVSGVIVQNGSSIDAFTNGAGGSIAGDDKDGIGFLFDGSKGGTLGAFINAGSIGGQYGVELVDGHIDSVLNDTTGMIGGTESAIYVSGSTIETFRNAGTIAGDDLGIYFENAVLGGFVNRGTISGGLAGIELDTSTIDSFHNARDGRLEGVGMGLSAYDVSLGALINDGQIASVGIGMSLDSVTIGTLLNTGTISGAVGVYLYESNGVTLENSGTIEGMLGIAFDDAAQGSTIINSGVVRGTSGTAIDFGCSCSPLDNSLILRTGSRIYGSVLFGTGDDRLDFSGFAGSTVLHVPGLDAVTPGTRHYVWDQPSDTVAIFDADWLGTHRVGQGQLDIVAGINAFLKTDVWPSAPLPGAGFTTNYAPRPFASAAETAVASALDTGADSGRIVWGGVIGNASGGPMPAVFGGLMAGAHLALDSQTSLGGLAGLVASHATLTAAQQSIDAQTALGGFYGKTDWNGATVDYSLFAGVQALASTRRVVTPGGDEIARGRFGAAFLAPGAGFTVPVRDDLALTASATGVIGATTAYGETGSSANLDVGAEAIAALDARLGVETTRPLDTAWGDATATVRGGLLAQLNGGSASVPVTLLGQTQSVATPAAGALGLYAGAGFDVPLGAAALALSADASLRTDGAASLALRGGLKGSF